MAELILHHVDLSPFAARVRLMRVLKRLSWRSRHPHPTLLPGGHRGFALALALAAQRRRVERA